MILILQYSAVLSFVKKFNKEMQKKEQVTGRSYEFKMYKFQKVPSFQRGGEIGKKLEWSGDGRKHD